MIRISKIIAALFISLIGSFFFFNNLFNLESAYSVVSYVVSGVDQPNYKIYGPVSSSVTLNYLALIIIMSIEFVIGLLGFFGTYNMVKNRNKSLKKFNEAKKFAISASLLGMFFWYGFFVIIGEGYFQMWQTMIGLGSVEGAFRYGTVCAALAFYISFNND